MMQPSKTARIAAAKLSASTSETLNERGFGSRSSVAGLPYGRAIAGRFLVAPG